DQRSAVPGRDVGRRSEQHRNRDRRHHGQAAKGPHRTLPCGHRVKVPGTAIRKRNQETTMRENLIYSRRELFRRGGRVISTIGAAAAFAPFSQITARAQGPDYKAMVCIFLFGGNDSNNMIVPMSQYSAYASIRQNLALGQAALLQAPTTKAGAVGLHPSLQ